RRLRARPLRASARGGRRRGRRSPARWPGQGGARVHRTGGFAGTACAESPLVAEIRSVLYDADGNEVEDEARAVRGVVLELDDAGEVVREVERWEVDPKSLDGDEGELPTRPHEA